MPSSRAADVGFGVAVHLVRFGVILGGLGLCSLVGITGWYAGFVVNVLCALFAVALVTHLGLWGRIGARVRWRGTAAALLLVVPLAEALLWLFPGGLTISSPGAGWWAASLFLVGLNEELVSRGVVLDRMRRGFGPLPAVAITAALFGLQHLSAFATTSRGSYDVLTNVLVSACYGFALASWQLRFAWIWPLVLVHGLADFTTIHSTDGHSDAWVAATLVVFVSYGLLVLRTSAPVRASHST